MKKLFTLALAAALVCALCNFGFFAVAAQGSDPWEKRYNQGVTCREKGWTEDAISCFEQAIQVDPSRPAAYFQLAQVFLDRQDAESAYCVLQMGAQVTGDEVLAADSRALSGQLDF